VKSNRVDLLKIEETSNDFEPTKKKRKVNDD